MSKNINLIAFGTFGSTHGYTQTFFTGNGELSAKIKTFDLNRQAIKLFPNSKLWAIRKETISEQNSIAYSIYNYAKEQSAGGEGAFIGSSILYVNEMADEAVSINLLNEFNEGLLKENVVNGIINKKHSDELSVYKPSSFDEVSNNLRPIEGVNFSQSSNRNLAVYFQSEGEVEELKKLFASALDLLNVYDTIYFTDSSEVVAFVRQKGMFELVDSVGFYSAGFYREIERKQESNDLIAGLAEAAKYTKKFSEQIDAYINKLKSGEEINQVKKLYEDTKRTYENNINKLKQPSFIPPPQPPRDSSDSRRGRKNPVREPNNSQRDNQPRQSEAPIKQGNEIAFVIAVCVVLLCIVALIYFLLPKEVESFQPSARTQTENSDENATRQELNPPPNGELSDNDWTIVASQGIKGKTVEEIVKIIFKKCPNDINRHYKGQEKTYARILKERNEDCFEGNKCIKKDLKHIPTFKEPAKKPITETPTENSDVNSTGQELNPPPNGELNFNDWLIVTNQGIKGKTVEEIVDIIFEQNFKDINSYYKNQKESYARILKEKNKYCFEGNKLTECLLKHIPSFKEPAKKPITQTENSAGNAARRQLNPPPNSELNVNECLALANQGIEGRTVEEIVDIIFELYFMDINNYYYNQKKTYARILKEKNEDCFEGNKCIKNALQHIPSFKASPAEQPKE